MVQIAIDCIITLLYCFSWFYVRISVDHSYGNFSQQWYDDGLCTKYFVYKTMVNNETIPTEV